MRILGVNIPDNKKIKVALTYIYGIGHILSSRTLAETSIDGDKLAKDLTSDELNKIKNYVEKTMRIEGDLKQVVKQNINRLKDLRTYRGARHARRLPVRGQNTQTNSRTVRGNTRNTAGSGKRKVDLK